MSKARYIFPVMKDNRIKNLELLVKKLGSQRKIVDHAQVNKASISNALKGDRGLGEALARRIETNLGLPPMWMDRNNTEVPELAFQTNQRARLLEQEVITAALDKAYEHGLTPSEKRFVTTPYGTCMPDLLLEKDQQLIALEIKIGGLSLTTDARGIDQLIAYAYKLRFANADFYVFIAHPSNLMRSALDQLKADHLLIDYFTDVDKIHF